MTENIDLIICGIVAVTFLAFPQLAASGDSDIACKLRKTLRITGIFMLLCLILVTIIAR